MESLTGSDLRVGSGSDGAMLREARSERER